MKVQIWSDFVCPFCYIGKHQLEKAIKEMDEDVEIEIMSYELDPDYVDKPDLDIHEAMADKNNQPIEKTRETHRQVEEMAKDVGLTYNYETMKYSNTFKAHKVFQKAKEIGKGNIFSEILMESFFTNGLYLNDEETLIELADKVGISKDDVLKVLSSDEYSLKVRQDEQWARTIEAKGAPHFVIDDKVSVSGAQGSEVFKEAMEYVQSLRKPKEFSSEMKTGMVCDDESCDVTK